MFIKPKREKLKPKQPKQKVPKPHPEYPEYVRTKQMAQSRIDILSRDWVVEHKKLDILSMEYVIEHGTDYEDEEIGFDEADFFFVCNLEGYFTGLIYEIYDNGSLMSYTFYKDGLKDGVKVQFYPSGKIHYYSFYRKGEITGIFYEWYENGMIKKFIDRRHNKRIEVDEQGNIVKQGKV